VLELKVGKSTKDAIRKIHDKQYYLGLKNKEYKGKILLVGINCIKGTKNYSCIIEEYNDENEIIQKINNDNDKGISNQKHSSKRKNNKDNNNNNNNNKRIKKKKN